MSADPLPPSRAPRRALGAAALLLLFAWTAFVHHGAGPYDGLSARSWWQPRAFLVDSGFVGHFDDYRLALAVLSLPAVLLAAGVFASLRSAVVRTLAVAAVLATGMFLFYGLREPGPRIWEFFRWRSSAVMLCVSLVLASSLMAPWLAASWLRRGWPLRAAAYLPAVLLVVAAESGATGTNPHLAFNISPWPVVTVFGLGGGATLVAALLACVALGVAAWHHHGRRQGLALAGLMLAVAAPVAWGWLRLGGGLALLGAALVVGALALGLSVQAAGDLAGGLRSAGGTTALGAVLVAVPLFAGQGCVQLDYRATRDGTAQSIIDALATYEQREGVYPDSLDELVSARLLPAIPSPQIGLPGLGEEKFSYQSFGTNYILEFAAPGWVQCAYNPPWEDEDESDDPLGQGEEGQGAEAGDDFLPGVWSCPSEPPELW